jgi:hypothetical protein
MGEKRNICMVWWGIVKERDHSEIEGRKISEWFVKKECVGTQT